MATIKDVSEHLGVSWDMVKQIEKAYLKKKYAKPKLKQVKRIAIDEFAVKKGHVYMTVVIDLDTGAILYVGHGKDAASLDGFFKRLKQSRAKIFSAATDMSSAYISAVSKNLPEAIHVFDHFHVVKAFNDTLSELRRKEYRTASAEHKAVIKGTRWLLLKNMNKLDLEKKEDTRLFRALAINRTLQMAYYLKEELKLIWTQNDQQSARKQLMSWVRAAFDSGVDLLMKFARSLITHRHGILNYYKSPISTGKLEGINNKIKVMKRKAYGYRDMEFFMLKLLAMHER